VSNVSWGIAAAAALAAGGLLTTAAIQDARAANDLAALSAAEPRLAAGVQPLPGGAALSLSLSL
jgi:hypothetical protein